MERLTGVTGNVRVGKGIVPMCHNNGAGEGNCLGMIKHGTCPAIRLDSERGKFPECKDFITQQEKNSQCDCGN